MWARRRWWWWWLACVAAGGERLGLAGAVAEVTPHPLLAGLQDEPASPRPSLRSQLRAAATNPEGSSVLQVDSQLCTNDLADGEALDYKRALWSARRLVLHGRPPPPRHLHLLLDVMRDSAIVYIQGAPVKLYDITEGRWAEGGVVAVAVVHQATGRLLCRYRHPAHAHARPLLAFLRALQSGRLILLVGQSHNAPAPSVISLLADLGVDVSWERGSGGRLWAWLTVVGGGGGGGAMMGGTSVTLHPKRHLAWEIHLPKDPEAPWCEGVGPPAWVGAGDGRWTARVELCSAHDGYGAWCTCPSPPSPSPPPPLQVGVSTWGSNGVVTVVLASHSAALHRLLVSLAAAGAAAEDLLVFTAQREAPKEMRLVCQSHGVHLEPTGRASDCMGLHVTRLYESALRAALILRPKATFIVTLEDDMEVFPSFYRWMSRGRTILKETQEFVCVNSLNPKDPYNPHEYPPRTLNPEPLPEPWEPTTTTTEPLRTPKARRGLGGPGGGAGRVAPLPHARPPPRPPRPSLSLLPRA
ncbi:uncharacterized protein LOC127004905 isoform X2 [Eriocheir sinensis]|uniref:uncharacterized protein LOC127004905 isoform X2 n=1 Tax=Eriocheir sinensis TaxID=95602 RepID=UPI0021C88357|nr:uncharacterized protein LOC127004905 isoform X2 [Eriocheir sinensis]